MFIRKRLYYIFYNQLNFVFIYLITIYFARSLSVNEFGEFSYIKNTISIGLFIIWFGLDRASLHLIKNINIEKVAVNNFIKSLAFIIFLLIYSVLLYYNILIISRDYALLILAVLFISIFDIKYLFDITKNVEMEIIFSFFKILPVAGFVIYSISLNTNITIDEYVILFTFGYFLYISSQYVYYKIYPLVKLDKEYMNSALLFSKFVFLGGLFSYLNNFLDSYMIMYFYGSYETGIYSSAYIIFFGLLSLTAIFIRFFISDTLNIRITKKGLVNYIKKMLFFSFAISIITFMSSDLIIYLLGSKYEESLIVLHILLVAFILISTSSIYGNLLISNGFSKEYMISMFIAFIINFILNFIFIPYFGIIAAAITTTISSVCTFLITYYFFKLKVMNQCI